MDIFVFNKTDYNHISDDLLKEFEHKKFSNMQKWKEHCLSYLMLDRILKEVYKISNRDIVFINKKPYLKNKAKIFSLSHSGNFIAIAFSDSECGIDIEQIKNRPFEDIANRMKLKCQTLEDFYYEWTKYEAEYKLNNRSENYKQFLIEDYAITAVSCNPQESFDIFIQNKEIFPNAQN